MTRSRYRVVVEVEAVVDVNGTRQTFYFGYEDWMTGPTDTPANTPVRGLLRSAGRFARNLFQGAGVTGRVTPDYGYAVLANPRPRELEGAGELDDWAGYSVSGCRYVVRRGLCQGTSYPDDYQTVFVAYGLSAIFADDAITIRLRDEGLLLDQPIVTEGFSGAGGLEGSGSVPKRKQWVSEAPGFFQPICVNPTLGIYYVQSTSTQGLHDSYLTTFAGATAAPFDVFVKGVKQTRVAPNYTSGTQLQLEAPSAGEARYWFGPVSTYLPSWHDGPVYFRIDPSASPSDVRVFAVGGPTDADHARRGVPLGSFFASHIALRAGVPLERIDTDHDLLIVGEQLVDDDRTYADVLSDAGLALQGYFTFNRLGLFRSGYLLDPADDGFFYGVDPTLFGSPPAAQPTTSAYTFTRGNVLLRSLKREPVSGMEAPLWSFSVQSGDTWPCVTDEAADPLIREYLAREVWAAASGVDTNTKTADPGAGHLTIETRGKYLDNAFGMRLMLERLCVLYAGRRHFWRWEVLIDDEMPTAVLELDLGDVVTLQFPHMGLASGIKVRLVAVEIDLQSPQHRMVFVGWGGTKGQLTPGAGGDGGGGGGDTGGTHPVAAAVALIEDFSGVMYGAVSTGGSSGSSGSADTIDDFTGQIIGRVIDDANFGDVVLLMHCEADSPWVDSSMLAATLTASGTITASSSSPLVGSKSMVPGALGKVDTPTAAAYNMGTGAVTVECTLHLTGTPSTERLFEIGSLGAQVWFNGSTRAPSVIVGGSVIFTGTAIPATTTGHLALVRTGASSPYTWTLYWEGSSIGSGTSTTVDDGTTNRTITVGNFNSATQPAVTCKIDEFRVTKGVSRYTGTFTPPSTPYPGL